MNKKIILGIIIFSVFILGGCAGQGKESLDQKAMIPVAEKTDKIPNNVPPIPDSEKGPDQVVGEYYTSIISYLNKKTNTDNSLNTEYVTNKIIDSYQKAKKMPANPFLCAQDYPDDASKLSVTQVSRNDFSAKFNVIVFTNWPSISVTVVKENGKWKINEIACSNGNKM